MRRSTIEIMSQVRRRAGAARDREGGQAMAVSTIDGTLEEVVLKKVRGKNRIYERLTFRLADGGTKSLAKSIVHQDLGPLIEPGISGRFYLYTAIDHRGIHGVRASDGREGFVFGKANETAMLLTVVVGIALIAVNLAMDRLSIWGVLLIILGIPGYFLYRSTRVQATRQYEGDGAAPSAA